MTELKILAIFSINNIKISGIAAAVPTKTVNNNEYGHVTAQERKMLIKTTGIEKRHIVEYNTTTGDLCYEAAKQLIKDIKWNKSDIGIIILVTQSPDYLLPSTAIILQDRLGLSKTCIAFDVNLGCSGYVTGLSIIGNFMAATGIKKGLLLAGDVSSTTCSTTDKSTYPLFGDAGTATALEFSSDAQPMHFNLENEGSKFEAIHIKDGGVRNPVSKESFEVKNISEGINRNNLHLILNGMEVFHYAITEIPRSVNALLNQTETDVQNLDYFVMHQANLLMNETIRKKVGIPASETPYSLKEYGNTSSASIPLTMISQLKNQLKNKQLTLLLSGFGVGLSLANVLLKTENVFCSDIIKVD